MGDKIWLLVKGDEDGNPLTILTDTGLRALLNDPSDFGVYRFQTLGSLPPDPNYWPDGVGSLLCAQQVMPEPSGQYRLPAEFDV